MNSNRVIVGFFRSRYLRKLYAARLSCSFGGPAGRLIGSMARAGPAAAVARAVPRNWRRERCAIAISELCGGRVLTGLQDKHDLRNGPSALARGVLSFHPSCLSCNPVETLHREPCYFAAINCRSTYGRIPPWT